jgi:DNA-binding NarL/FixJ family response regulator
MTTSRSLSTAAPSQPSVAGRCLKLLIVDADHRVRDSLAGLLGLGDAIDVVGSAGHAAAALELCETCLPDAVILDPRLPDLDAGRGLIDTLRARFPAVHVLVMCWPDAPGIEAAVLGADGFVPKSIGPHELVERIGAIRRSPSPRRRPV